MSNLEVLEINLKNICDDFKNHSVDIYIAKIEVESIIKKLLKFQQEQDEVLNLKAKELLLKAKKFLELINHEISLQTKEEYFNLNNNEI